MDAAARKALLRWYGANKRDLPWRRTSDPYAIWVSEVMLQQTQVATVVPRYESWMRRFPTRATLAAATQDEVMAEWSGLGYYRRARNLHAAAKAAGPRMPVTADGLRELPGIGDYTAAAIASIAHGEPVACVDGNVERVVARVAAITRPGDARRDVRHLAQTWLDPARPGDWNQAMMELGATVCTPHAPRCGECPVAAACQAKQLGRQELIPAPRRKAAPPRQIVRFAVVQRRGRVLLVRRQDGLLGGLWSLPGGPGPVAASVQQQAGVVIVAGRAVAAVRHDFTHRRWDMRVHVATPTAAPVRLGAGAKWVPVAALRTAGLATAMRKALRAAGLQA